MSLGKRSVVVVRHQTRHNEEGSRNCNDLRAAQFHRENEHHPNRNNKRHDVPRRDECAAEKEMLEQDKDASQDAATKPTSQGNYGHYKNSQPEEIQREVALRKTNRPLHGLNHVTLRRAFPHADFRKKEESRDNEEERHSKPQNWHNDDIDLCRKWIDVNQYHHERQHELS